MNILRDIIKFVQPDHLMCMSLAYIPAPQNFEDYQINICLVFEPITPRMLKKIVSNLLIRL